MTLWGECEGIAEHVARRYITTIKVFNTLSEVEGGGLADGDDGRVIEGGGARVIAHPAQSEPARAERLKRGLVLYLCALGERAELTCEVKAHTRARVKAS